MLTMETHSNLRRIGEYLACAPGDIEWALSVQRMELALGNAKRLGEILIERECIARETLIEALELQRIDRLRRCSLLADLSREELVRIGEKSIEIQLEVGQALFREGQKGTSAYVMLRGRLLLSHSAEGWEHPAGTALPGDVLGEEEFVNNYGNRLYTAYATEPSALLQIGYDLIPKPAKRGLRTVPLYSTDDLIRRTREVLRADRAYFFLWDDQTGELALQVDEDDPAFGFKIMAGTDIAGWVALTRKTVNLLEAYLDPRFDPALDIITGYWTRTLLAVPVLNSKQGVIGVLEALNKRFGAFNSDDEALLHALAHQYAPLLGSRRR